MTMTRALCSARLGTVASGLWLAGLLATGGCHTDEQLNPAPLTTASTGDPDGGAGGTAPAPPRRLVAPKLFGTMALDNTFHDPAFAMLDGTGWMPVDYSHDVFNEITRVHLARTPGQQPALRLWAPPTEPESSVVGEAKGVAGPVVVSVWLGRKEGSSPTVESGAALIGLYMDGSPSSVDLLPDESPAPVTLDGMSWQRLSAQLTDGPVGFTYLRVTNQAQEPLYLTSPSLTAVDAQRNLRSSHQGTRRPLREAEASALRAATERKRRQLGGPGASKP